MFCDGGRGGRGGGRDSNSGAGVAAGLWGVYRGFYIISIFFWQHVVK